MIISALVKYYDILNDDPESVIAPSGYSVSPVYNLAVISGAGELLDIVPNMREVTVKGKIRSEPIRLKLPERVSRSSNVSANYLCDKGEYFFGLAYDKAKNTFSPNAKYFEAFREKNIDFLSAIPSAAARAAVEYLKKWKPSENTDNEILLRHKENLSRDTVFCLEKPTAKINENTEVLKRWEDKFAQKENAETILGQCAILGKTLPIARLHKNLIKGIDGAQSSGASLVSFNSTALESYNKEQSYNSSVSSEAAKKYTTVLNWLLERGNGHLLKIGESSVVFWAEESGNGHVKIVDSLLGETVTADEDERKELDDRINSILKSYKNGEKPDYDALGVNGGAKFHILGLSPNASRISVRFYINYPTFADFLESVCRHYADMEIVKSFESEPDNIPIWAIARETVSPKARDKTPTPLLTGAVSESVFTGRLYPDGLLYEIINRVKTDNDKNITYIRAAIIKACLTRKNRILNNNKKEDITMALNRESKEQAYQLGRLFAVLEKAQEEAIPGANSTIKDRYFSSACSAPASVFPTLLKLAVSHIAKLDYGVKYEKLVGEILGANDDTSFPTQLNLDDQGRFIIGYYHQRNDFFKSTKNNKEENN
ncbi:MAG: type I-C CRISPR-associated protein Cas8c/Csd1 [Clostridiales bacterium]|jgi:CRISPR-associated protein Csd1|nr:type I-C CRISPR-associated protein Cas8c/Csd1 [Clostridiales bacterium]